MNGRILGSIFRLRQLAQEFGHFWSYGVNPETLAELFQTSASFAEFQEKLQKACAEQNIAPVGGRYLEDAYLKEGWLIAHFGGNNQLRVALNPDKIIFRAEYTNGHRHTSAVYDDITGDLTWESPPPTPRDAVRVLRVLAVLAEADHRMFVKTHLPPNLKDDEASLYMRVPSWAYLWISPAVLEDVLPAR